MSGFVSEKDSSAGANYYSLQANANTWTCTVTYSTTCWEQFIFDNLLGSSEGQVYIQYQLLANYSGLHNGCPTNWTSYNAGGGDTDCYMNSNTLNTHQENPSGLATPIQLKAQADYSSSGDDVVRMCDASQCWAVTEFDNSPFSNNPLYSNWKQVEWNVFGLSKSGAEFNVGSSTTISVSIDVTSLATDSGTSITPTVVLGGTTGEWNNMNLTGTTNAGSGYYSFSEN